MSLSPEDLQAIRERAESVAAGKSRELWSIAQEDRVDLLAEVDRLTEKVVVYEKRGLSYYEAGVSYQTLQARLDKVRALVGEIGAEGCLGYDECCAEPVVQRIAAALDGEAGA